MKPLAEVDDFDILDLADLSGQDQSSALEQLAAIHREHFPEHGYAVADLRAALSNPDPGILVHAWLMRFKGQPIGEYIFHVCLRRKIVLIHYVALNPDAREHLPAHWLHRLTDLLQETAEDQAAQRGVDLYGIAGEMFPTQRDYRRWRSKGFLILKLDYQEPRHGEEWPEAGELYFAPMTLGVRLLPAGEKADPLTVLNAVLGALLVDHYHLPEDHPAVITVRREAQEVGLTEVDEVTSGASLD